MAPTNALSSSPLSSSPQQYQTLTEMTKTSADDRAIELSSRVEDLDNSCETYFCSCDFNPSPRSVIPEASNAFREALIKMKDDEERLGYASLTSSLPSSQPKVKASSSPPKESRSIFSRLSPSRFSSSSSSKSTLSSSSSKQSSTSSSSSSSPNRLSAPTTKRNSKMDAKRPASFGGADVEKPQTGRRASQCEKGSEKRVSWADHRGSQFQLINVRLIRPRVDMDCSTGFNKTPGQSILRTRGIK